MPLVTFAGRPCTGKTTHAKALEKYLQSKGVSVVVVNEESEGIEKADGYKDATSEKVTRATLKGAAVRKLTRKEFVILDSSNYFKSYRYEMYRFAVEQGTPSCVIWVDAPLEQALEWNRAREDAYDEAVLKDLWKSFEVPNENNRWDAPLFVQAGAAGHKTEEYAGDYGVEPMPEAGILTEESEREAGLTGAGEAGAGAADAEAEATDETKAADLQEFYEGGKPIGGYIPFDEVYTALTTVGKDKPINHSTIKVPLSETNLLHQLDTVTKSILTAVVAALPGAYDGSRLTVPNVAQPVVLTKKPTAAQLRRLRRQFLKLTKTHPPENAKDVGTGFVQYINSALNA